MAKTKHKTQPSTPTERRSSPRSFFIQSIKDEALSFRCDPERPLTYGCRAAVRIVPEGNWQPGILKTRKPYKAKRLHALVTLEDGTQVDFDKLEPDQVVRIVAEYRDL